jgi:putative ABC transport system permease protein
MKQLYYVFKTLLRRGGNSWIKVISLSAGLLVGIVLFARVAFEQNFDTFYPDAGQLYRVMSHYTVGGDVREPIPQIHASMPEAMKREFPEIAGATVVAPPEKRPFFYGEKKFEPETIYADSLFFQTMGLDVIQGDDRLLGVRDNLFLSESMAQTIFGQEEPIGKTLVFRKRYTYTIQGIFKDIPENSHLRFDAVGSFVNMKTQFQRQAGWMSDGSYYGYIRLLPGADPKVIDEKLPEMIGKYKDVEADAAKGQVYSHYLIPVTDAHSADKTVKRMMLILSLLGVAILFVAAMNYVLISISSLASRAKAIGVHKCNGASSGSIFRMFIYETAILIFIACLLCVFCLFVFRGMIEGITDASLAALFSLSNLWVVLPVVGALFLLAGILPARIFAGIPVTQVFRAKTVANRHWKRVLLFSQFAGITFVLVLLAIVLMQYRMVLTKDLGYEPDNVVSAPIEIGGKDWNEYYQNVTNFKQEFERLPFVESAATNYFQPITGYGAMPVVDENNVVLFMAQYNVIDLDYPRTIGMHFVAGADFTDENQVIVNETFVKLMGWTDSPIGKEVRNEYNSYGQIVGVVKDYAIKSLYNEQQPILTVSWLVAPGHITLRLTDVTPERIKAVNDHAAALYPTSDIEFVSLKEALAHQYDTTKRFKDSVTSAFVVILLITVIGLFGYISDEIFRRRKEIAIRKVNGATAEKILQLLYKDVSYTALPAIVIGIMIAFIIGRNWLKEFAVKVTLNPEMFLLCGLSVMALIVMSITLRTWNAANENPVNSLKSE